LLLLCLAALPAIGLADDEASESPFTFEVGGGFEYDSNVALLELDTSANASDTKRLFDLGVGYDMPEKGRLDFSAGYSFSDSAHDEFDAFDVGIHRVSSTLSYDMGRVDAGVILQHAEAELDGNDFLTLTQISPYVSKLAGKRVFLRFAYADTDKDFAGNPGRAANSTGLSSDFYLFLDGVRTYLLFGIRHDDEDSIDPAFDYSGQKLRVQFSHRFPLDTRELTFKVGARSEHRDYENETPSIGNIRNDHRVQIEATVEIPLTERLTGRLEYKNVNNRSNLVNVDFREEVLAASLTATF
jgi:hypothetical protein